MISESDDNSTFERYVYTPVNGDINLVGDIPKDREQYAEINSSRLDSIFYGKASFMGVLLRPHEQNGKALTGTFTLASMCFHYAVYCWLKQTGISLESTLPDDIRFTWNQAIDFLENYSWLGRSTRSILARVVDLLLDKYTDLAKIIVEPHYGVKTNPHDNTSDLIVCCASGARWAVELKCYHRRTGTSLVRLLEGLTRCDEVIFVCPGQIPQFVVCIGRWSSKTPSILKPTTVIPKCYVPTVSHMEGMTFISDFILHKRCRTHHGLVIHALIMLGLTTRAQMQRITPTYRRLAGAGYMSTFVNKRMIPYMQCTFFPMLNIKVVGHFRSNVCSIVNTLVKTLGRPIAIEFKTKWLTEFRESRSLGQKIADYVSVIACDRQTVTVVARITMEFKRYGTFRGFDSNEGAAFHVEVALDRTRNIRAYGHIYTASEHSLGQAPDTRLWDHLYCLVPCKRHNRDTDFRDALVAFK